MKEKENCLNSKEEKKLEIGTLMISSGWMKSKMEEPQKEKEEY